MRLAKQLDRVMHRSWLSAALNGRFTGSGSIFAGQEDRLTAMANDALEQAKRDAQLQLDQTIANAQTATAKAIGGTAPPKLLGSGALVAGLLVAGAFLLVDEK